VWPWRKKTQPSPQRDEFPFRGAPARKRLKTHSAATGYVYQYFYIGYRKMGPESGDLEYVFRASSDRQHYHPISVILGADRIVESSARRGRTLTEAEKYAVAKLSLFTKLDQEGRAVSERIEIRPDSREIDCHLGTLGRL
jgi:hypothetical protein